MFEPVRGGTRGGQAEFKWSDVSADKDRENYLGHSINAPTGRWQKNKDVHWYNRDVDAGAAERAEEIRKVKEAEADALAVALGFEPAPKKTGDLPTAGSTAGSASPTAVKAEPADAQKALEKEEKRRRKAERKEEKRLKKERKRSERVGHDIDEVSRHRRDHRSRSRSPPRHRSQERVGEASRHRHPRSRSRTPPIRRHDTRDESKYDDVEREKERDRARRRYEASYRREDPQARWGAR
ncbi:hypothetical protein PLICRDRAFT_51259 [Plicaturopsis crispa FD-325 SS-3]|nr:hypothetical protein PLICRDRAFT_51259 [Plicaturopsis crispa FD-325 SS-3]